MKSKYKERAKEILLAHTDEYLTSTINAKMDSKILEAMCQLAEEVEKVYKDPLMFGEEGSIQRVYSKAYVEELLQKQRELCSRKAKHGCTRSKKEVPKGQYFNLSPLYYFLDKDSILNAKLKID